MCPLHTLEQAESPMPLAHSMHPISLLVPTWLSSLVLHVVGNRAAVTPDSSLFKFGDPTYCFPAPVHKVPGKSAADPAWVTAPALGCLRPGCWHTPSGHGRSTPATLQSGRDGGGAAPQSDKGAVARRRKKDTGQTKPANVQPMNFLSGSKRSIKAVTWYQAKEKRKSGCLGLRARCWKFFGSLLCSVV